MKMTWLLLPALVMLGCKKESQPLPHPAMDYTDLQEATVSFGGHKALNPNSDTQEDLLFSTLLVGDPLLQRDRQQYYASGSYYTSFLVNESEQTPALSKGDTIGAQSRIGYDWYNASSIVLAEKIIELNGTERWEGNWKAATHKYLAIQIRKGEVLYNGWVEISFNTTEGKTILHKAAICREAGKAVRAGY